MKEHIPVTNTTMELKDCADRWTLDEKHGCWCLEDVLYTAKARVPKFQRLSIFVPRALRNADGSFAPQAAKVPVVFENNSAGYMQMPHVWLDGPRCYAQQYLDHGLIYVSCGCRGRESRDAQGALAGKGPASLVDIKTALRFLRHNRSCLPGDWDKVISVGWSAGGAMSTLLARMTRNFKDRNTMATVSSILNNAVGLAVGTMITGLQLSFGWFNTGVILGVIAGVLILVTGLTCKETVGMESTGTGKPEKTVPLKKQLPAVLKNKYFWLALILGALTLLVNANAIGAQIFYCNVVLQDPMYMGVLMTFGMLPGILVLFIMPYFANKFSKRVFMAGGALLMIAGFSITGMADTNRTLLAVGTIIRAVGIGPMFAGLYAFCADAADYGEWKFGVRSEGLMASSQSIGSKVGIGFGSACTAWILAAAGYVQPALDALPPLEGGEGPMGALPPMIEQPASVIAAIRFDYGWLGAIISVVLLIGVLMMDVEKYMPEIRRSLGDKKPVQM